MLYYYSWHIDPIHVLVLNGPYRLKTGNKIIKVFSLEMHSAILPFVVATQHFNWSP